MMLLTTIPIQSGHSQGDTRVAVLGTLTEFTDEPLPYDMQALLQLVQEIHPDLLCLDLSPTEWQERDFGGLPQEYRQALLPLAESSDIVVVPIGTGDQPGVIQPTGWRGWLTSLARQALAYLQRTAPDPAAMNSGWRHELANGLYDFTAWLAGKQVGNYRMAHIQSLARNIIDIARYDPGAQILVVVNLQYCHHIRPMLREQPGIKVVPYEQLSVTNQ